MTINHILPSHSLQIAMRSEMETNQTIDAKHCLKKNRWLVSVYVSRLPHSPQKLMSGGFFGPHFLQITIPNGAPQLLHLWSTMTDL